MSFCPSDLFETPFSFGELEMGDIKVPVHCNCFAEDQEVEIRVVKRGDWVSINIPNVLVEPVKEEVNYGQIYIPSFLGEKYLGEEPRKRSFGCICMAFGLKTGRAMACPGIVRMDEEGNIRINPCVTCKETSEDGEDYVTGSHWFKTGPDCEGKIGFVTIQFSYIIGDLNTYDESNFEKDIL